MSTKSLLGMILFCLLISTPLSAQQQKHHTPLERDYSAYPIDSRKPCHICSRPTDCKAVPFVDLPGLRGRPHIDEPAGGCTCGKKCPNKRPMFSWNWPMPFSANREEARPQLSAWLEDPCRARFTNVYDRLGDFRLIQYKRTDSGYQGWGRDPYGCLGESRQFQSNVRGLQFRQPGEPVFGSPIAPTQAAKNVQQQSYRMTETPRSTSSFERYPLNR